MLSFYFLVNPIASSHFQNAQQQNLTTYSLHPNPMQVNHYNASFNSNNNFNNFDQSSNQYQSHYQQQQQSSSAPSSSSSSQYQVGNMQQQQNTLYQQTTTLQQQNMQQQFYGQSIPQQQQHQGIINGPSTATYQHTINDLLVHQPSTNYQQQTNMPYNNSQEHIPHQSVSVKSIFIFIYKH